MPLGAHAEPKDVRLFLGATRQQLDNTDAHVRAFTVVQDLLLRIDDRQPSKITRHLGDVVSWKGAADRNKVEQDGFTHYLIAEPYGIIEEDGPAVEIKWHIGAFSADKDRALDGWLKSKPGAARRVIFIPKLGSKLGPNLDIGYEPAAFSIREGKSWKNSDDNVVEDLWKVLKHVFPEMRTSNEYFIHCFEDALKLDELKGINMELMAYLSGRLQTTGWSPTVRLTRSQAEEICSDTEDRYKFKPNYRYEDADFLITGWLSWGVVGAKVRPSILVDDRVAEMRREYVVRASEPKSSGEPLEEFCVAPGMLRQTSGLNKLAEYIRGHGFKAGNATPLPEDWKCGPEAR
jgi:hypothetical protein